MKQRPINPQATSAESVAWRLPIASAAKFAFADARSMVSGLRWLLPISLLTVLGFIAFAAWMIWRIDRSAPVPWATFVGLTAFAIATPFVHAIWFGILIPTEVRLDKDGITLTGSRRRRIPRESIASISVQQTPGKSRSLVVAFRSSRGGDGQLLLPVSRHVRPDSLAVAVAAIAA
jgi:hypothetical protein